MRPVRKAPRTNFPSHPNRGIIDGLTGFRRTGERSCRSRCPLRPGKVGPGLDRTAAHQDMHDRAVIAFGVERRDDAGVVGLGARQEGGRARGRRLVAIRIEQGRRFRLGAGGAVLGRDRDGDRVGLRVRRQGGRVRLEERNPEQLERLPDQVPPEHLPP